LIESSDIPSLDPNANISGLALSPKDAFVLSRVDGNLSLDKISSISGIALDEIIEIFKRLAAEGVVKFSKAMHTSEIGKPKEKLSILEQLEEDEHYDNLSKIPREVRREVLMLEEELETINYYDLLKVAKGATNERIKKSYFKMSRDYHPDRFFGKEIGVYKKKFEKIFNTITSAFETLSDKKARQQYDIETFPKDKERATKREETAKDFNRPKTLIERLAQAKKFYKMGDLEFRKRNIAAAANYFKLALSYDPQNAEYKQALKKTTPGLDKKKARSKYEEAMRKNEEGFHARAMGLFSEAVELDSENADYNFELSKLLYALEGDVVRSKECCLKAIETMGDQSEVRVLMGKIYRKAGLIKNAIREFKLALKLDKENKTARMELNEIK